MDLDTSCQPRNRFKNVFPVEKLGNDILVTVLSIATTYLSDLVSYRLVCKRWNQVARSSNFYAKLTKITLNGTYLIRYFGIQLLCRCILRKKYGFGSYYSVAAIS